MRKKCGMGTGSRGYRESGSILRNSKCDKNDYKLGSKLKHLKNEFNDIEISHTHTDIFHYL